MKKFFSRTNKTLLVAIALCLASVVAVSAAVIHYNLNQTVTVNYTVTENVTNVDVTLASDLLGNPLTGPITLTTSEGGTLQGAVYFDANKIKVSSIQVASNASGFGYVVGTPSGATGFCPIAFWLTGAVPPSGSFTFAVTGNNT